jgi:hypothetical protein
MLSGISEGMGSPGFMSIMVVAEVSNPSLLVGNQL